MSNGTLKLVVVIAAIGMYALSQKSETTPTEATAQNAQSAETAFDRAKIDAMVKCQPEIEQQAKYDFRWPGWFGGVYFIKWRALDNGQMDFIGENVEFQNGFGNWVRMSYVCRYDIRAEKLVNVTVIQGRL